MDAITLSAARLVETTSAPIRSETKAKAPDESGRAPAARENPQPPVKPELLAEAAAELAVRFNLKVEMGQDEGTGRSVVRIYSQDGDRLLRQIPAEASLRILDRLRSGDQDGLLGLTI